MRVLFIAPINSVFVQGLVKHLKNQCPEWEFDILTIQKSESKKVEEYFESVYWPRMFSGLLKPLNLLAVFICFMRTAGRYDVINIQFNRYLYVLCAMFSRRKGDRLVVSYWGSDFMRLSKSQKPLIKIVNSYADDFTVTSDDSLPILKKSFALDEGSVRVLHFGLDALEHISRFSPSNQAVIKQKLNLDKYSYIIALGYNGDAAQQHLKMIDVLLNISDMLPSDYLILLPFTYKIDSEYRVSVETKLVASNLRYRFLDYFLSAGQMAEHWYAVDMFVHMQTTDQLSGSMFENIACGNVVIAGSWLNYSVLDNNDIYLAYTDFEKLGNTIMSGIQVRSKQDGRLQRNRTYILNNFSWSAHVDKWISLYSR